MTIEEKQILLKDLCARLPYGVICNDNRHGSGRVTCVDITPDDIEQKNDKVVVYYFDFDECGDLKNCKPYLRPMSSMTEEEIKEYKHLIAFSGSPDGAANLVDWLNKKMFAYRTIDGKDMFKLGLALEAPEGMYKEE